MVGKETTDNKKIERNQVSSLSCNELKKKLVINNKERKVEQNV